MTATDTSSENAVDLSEIDRLNRTSWAMVKSECDRLERMLTEKNITLDQFFKYLESIDPSSSDRLAMMSDTIKEIFHRREKMNAYFESLAHSSPASAPVRFRRLNRV